MRSGLGLLLYADVITTIVEELMGRIAALGHLEDKIVAFFTPYLLYSNILWIRHDVGGDQSKDPVLVTKARRNQTPLANPALNLSRPLQLPLFGTAHNDQAPLCVEKGANLLKDAVDLHLSALKLQHR